MQIDIKQLKSGDEATLERVAAEVFDEPIDAVRGRLSGGPAPPHVRRGRERRGRGPGRGGDVPPPRQAGRAFHRRGRRRPAWRRKSIARKLLDEMLALGKVLGCEEAWVGTEMGNLPARALFESYGVPGGRFVMYTFDL